MQSPVSNQSSKHELQVRQLRKAYTAMAKGKAIACDLGQNIVFGMFSDERCLFTLIRGMGVIWSIRDNRWLCASELRASMGWPVSLASQGAQGATLTTTHFSESHQGAARRTHRSQRAQVGNSMHLHAIGAVLLVTILKLRIGMADDEASLIDAPESKGRERRETTETTTNASSEAASSRRVTSCNLLAPLERVRSIRRRVSGDAVETHDRML